MEIENKHFFVLDACTLINIFCIDEADNFLYKMITSSNFKIAGTVCDEIKRNYRERKSITDYSEKKQNVDELIGTLYHYVVNDADIIKDIDSQFDKIKKFSYHTKKENGELLSSALSLVLSRFNNVKVVFYTDDMPAEKQFEELFRFQQIGQIGDSIDLLIFLHWSEYNFSETKLKEYLSKLRSEYGLEVLTLRRAIEIENKNAKKTDPSVTQLISALKNFDIDKIALHKDRVTLPKIRKIIDESHKSFKLCKQVLKVNKAIANISTHGIYNLKN